MCQAVPEIPLSVGSKLELLLSVPNFRILLRTLTHLSAYAYCHVYTMYMTEAPRVLHFSAFICIFMLFTNIILPEAICCLETLNVYVVLLMLFCIYKLIA